MWIALLITHGLLAFLLLGAITHQLVSVWAPVHARADNFIARYRAVGSSNYANAVVALYVVTMIMGGILYTNYRITVRLSLEAANFWKTLGVFEFKEHLMAIGLALLPAYWYYWQPSSDAANTRTRTALTTLLAFIVWWGFLIGHIVNNVRGIGT
jgi:hypothetical protein